MKHRVNGWLHVRPPIQCGRAVVHHRNVDEPVSLVDHAEDSINVRHTPSRAELSRRTLTHTHIYIKYTNIYLYMSINIYMYIYLVFLIVHKSISDIVMCVILDVYSNRQQH